MKHNQYNNNSIFVKEPESFDKYSEKEFLAYCLGATLYMPALRDFADIIRQKKIPGMTSLVVCFEDAIDEKDLPEAEKNTLQQLDRLEKYVNEGLLSYDDLPLVFLRARNIEQFRSFSERLTPERVRFIAGFVFPKFTSEHAEDYFVHLKMLNKRFDEVLYGMPIIESKEIAFKETRFTELMSIKTVLDKYKDLVLNVRVGATDFSSAFAVRRGIDYSIYDILPVRDCLLDILNVFARNNDYIISGPVWEYFLVSKEKKFDNQLEFSLQSSLLKRKRLIDEAVDGLLREVLLDKANGFIGKTAIHPTHIKYINAMLTVTEEEYDDAVQILSTSGGVIKSAMSNKMNEINPHRSWADKIYNRARAYGVVRDETEYLNIVSKEL